MRPEQLVKRACGQNVESELRICERSPAGGIIKPRGTAMTGRNSESGWQPAAYRNYKWIVRDPDLLGGKLAVRGTRLAVSFVLACLAEGMDAKEIGQTYVPIPSEAIPEIMSLASRLIDSGDVAT
ncbi:MAG: DUF433 domain-containing protein [Candidatus Binataceae bacterium]|jgi:uncharacterized protein (DUF433 family)